MKNIFSILPLVMLLPDAGGPVGGTDGSPSTEPVKPEPTDTAENKDLVNESRQPGASISTAVAGPGPDSPVNERGDFEGTPGEDVQKRDPLAPTERRSAVAGVKPETHVSRADTEAMGELTPGLSGGEHFDVRVVEPKNVDQEAKDRYDKAVADSRANLNRLQPAASNAPKKQDRSPEEQIEFEAGAQVAMDGGQLKPDASQAAKDGFASVGAQS